MGLKITLKPHEKIIINGAVIVNGKTKAEMILENNAAILRKKDILVPEEAKTPAGYLYLLVQFIYLFDEKREARVIEARKLLTEMIDQLPSLRGMLLDIELQFLEGHYYQALKMCRKLMNLEEEKFHDVLCAS